MAWGMGPWGGGPWGGAALATLSVLSVQAVSENVIRVFFSTPLYFSGILDPADASNAQLWDVEPVDGPVGYDGNPPRPVTAVVVSQPVLPNVQFGAALDLTLDRPMTPFPSQYSVATLGSVYSSDLTQQLVAVNLGMTPAIFRVLNPQDPTVVAPGRDLANPQTAGGALGSTIAQPQVAILGSFGYGADGDYAIDSKDTGLLKRLQRRLFTKKNGFLHLQDYGVDVMSYSKKLGRPSARQQLAADCEAQFSREPEVAQVNVLTYLDPLDNSLLRLAVYIKKKNGQTAKYGMKLALA